MIAIIRQQFFERDRVEDGARNRMSSDIVSLLDHYNARLKSRTRPIAGGDLIVMVSDQLGQAKRSREVGRPSAYEQYIYLKDLPVFSHEPACARVRRSHRQDQAVWLSLRRVGEMSSGSSTTSMSDTPARSHACCSAILNSSGVRAGVPSAPKALATAT